MLVIDELSQLIKIIFVSDQLGMQIFRQPLHKVILIARKQSTNNNNIEWIAK